MHVFGTAIRTALLAAILITGVGGTGLNSAAVAGPFERADAAYTAGEYAAAMGIWTVLADRGFARAQYNLGKMYFVGAGMPIDIAQSEKWWRMAAEQDHTAAQFNLGNLYYFGTGVSKDMVEAVKWYRRAADQGYPRAQFNLGLMYSQGDGVPQDVVQSYKWWSLAAAQGDEDSGSNIAAAAKLMTPEQIATAQRLASEWKINSR
tara:strand:- start:363 stop:977 length:615 start_codon:yes stop_codon:yes gene_type:complete